METTFLENELFWLIVTGSIAMCLLAISLVLLFNINQRRLLSKEAALQRIQLQHKEELLHHNIQTLEDERKRIAKDLHDEIGSMLYIIRLNILQVNAADELRGKELVTEAKTLIDRAIDSTRNISHRLLPPILEEFGLVETLRELVREVNRSDSLNIRYEVSNPGDLRIEAPYDLALFRIVQELVSNVIKHSGASEAILKLRIDEGRTMLEFEDNGKGFDLASSGAVKGIGLNNIQSRARMIGAGIHMESSPGTGTRTQITVTNLIPATA